MCVLFWLATWFFKEFVLDMGDLVGLIPTAIFLVVAFIVSVAMSEKIQEVGKVKAYSEIAAKTPTYELVTNPDGSITDAYLLYIYQSSKSCILYADP